MRILLLVFLGAGLGGVARHFVNLAVARAVGFKFPFATMIVNVSGSIVMGLATAYFALRAGQGWPHEAQLFVLTGVLGGYTTFSTFSLEAVTLIERRDYGGVALYVGGSVGLAIIGLLSALYLVQAP